MSPAGDFDYEHGGKGYATIRQTDPRIAAMVHAGLGDARTVLNVGAGAGSYEPENRYVIAVEPSEMMRGQRPPQRVPAVIGVAQDLPFDDDSFDAAMAMVTIHQWPDTAKGLSELRRVTRGPVVILTFDGDELSRFWLADYAPELIEAERGRYPRMDEICAALGERSEVSVVPVPIDCVDGFTEAFYARPEAFLDPEVRRSQSAWGFVENAAEERTVERLRADLDSGAWDEKYGDWREKPAFEGSLRLVVGREAG